MGRVGPCPVWLAERFTELGSQGKEMALMALLSCCSTALKSTVFTSCPWSTAAVSQEVQVSAGIAAYSAHYKLQAVSGRYGG